MKPKKNTNTAIVLYRAPESPTGFSNTNPCRIFIILDYADDDLKVGGYLTSGKLRPQTSASKPSNGASESATNDAAQVPTMSAEAPDETRATAVAQLNRLVEQHTTALIWREDRICFDALLEMRFWRCAGTCVISLSTITSNIPVSPSGAGSAEAVLSKLLSCGVWSALRMARARGANRGAEALTEARSHQGEARSADEHDCADTVK